MRRLVAVLMVVLIASLNATDGICCSDGCAYQQTPPSEQHGQAPTDGSCLFCLGGVDSSMRPEVSPSDVVTDRLALPPLARHVNPPAESLEHPPRV